VTAPPPSSSSNNAARARRIVPVGEAEIEVIAEGTGPVIVVLPSRGRDSEDFDSVAAAIAAAGFRVLRPQPRGIGRSIGPLDGLTLHDLARDVAGVIAAERSGPAVIVGHAFGNWVARMTAVDHPALVRGIVLAAAAAKRYPAELSAAVTAIADPTRPAAERLQFLAQAFFAPGHDPSPWLDGWHPGASRSQREAADRTPQAEWWHAGSVPLLDLQAGADPFRPTWTRDELRDELGPRVTIGVIPGTSHALLPEAPQAVADAISGWAGALPREPAGSHARPGQTAGHQA
jgi:pimeloyl-ACP methyl ester carboxylesterase